MSNLSESEIQKRLNRLAPAARDAHLGDVIEDLITNHNLLLASYNDLQTKYDALLAHLDTANVTGIGNANAATYGETATTAATIKTLSQR